MADKDSMYQQSAAQAPTSSSQNPENPTSQSLSNQNESSKKMEEAVPMELAVSAPIAEERRTGFKKIFMKLGQHVGIVKTSEFSKEYLDAVKDADQYKELVADLCQSLMLVCQQNPKLVPASFSNMEIEAPKGEDPLETLAQYLSSFEENFQNKEVGCHPYLNLKCLIVWALAATREVVNNLAATHRTLQQRARRALHFMRTFLNVECAAIDYERRLLMGCRQDMDFSRHEYTNNPNEAKRLTFERAQQRFNAQMAKVFELLNQIPQKKTSHAADLVNIFVELKKYHEDSYNECIKLRKYRAQFGSQFQYERL